MPDSRSKPAPKGLKKDGRKLWRSVVSAYDLRPDELILLGNACKTVDIIAALEVAMADEPLVTKGSMGQAREHPLLSEARQQRAQLNRTLAQLKLPDLVDPSMQGPRINTQRAAAQSRWQQWQYGQ